MLRDTRSPSKDTFPASRSRRGACASASASRPQQLPDLLLLRAPAAAPAAPACCQLGMQPGQGWPAPLLLERSDSALPEPREALAVLSRVSLSPRVTQESRAQTQRPQVRLLCLVCPGTRCRPGSVCELAQCRAGTREGCGDTVHPAQIWRRTLLPVGCGAGWDEPAALPAWAAAAALCAPRVCARLCRAQRPGLPHPRGLSSQRLPRPALAPPVATACWISPLPLLVPRAGPEVPSFAGEVVCRRKSFWSERGSCS